MVNGTRVDFHMKRLRNSLYAQGRRRRPGQSKKKKKEAASCKRQASGYLGQAASMGRETASHKLQA